MSTPKLLNALRAEVRKYYDRFVAPPFNADTGSGTTPWIAADSGYANAPTHLQTLAASHVTLHMRDPRMNQLCIEMARMGVPVSGAITDTGREGGGS
jgi:hypothetical protein